MVDQEAVRLMVQFAVLAQACRHSFTLFAGIDKNKALLSPRMFKM